MANEVVSFSTDSTLGTLSQPTALTNASGVATVTLSQASSATPNAAYVTASAQGLTASAGYSVGGGGSGGGATVGSVSLTATPSSATADGYTLITLKATVLDPSSAPMSNQVVTFTSAAGTLSNSTATTNSSGVAQVFLTAPTTAGSTNVVAYTGGVPASALITFVAGLPASVTLSATSSSIPALGNTTIVATLKDYNNNAVGAGQTVTFGTSSTTGGHFTTLSGTTATSTTTDALGQARMIYVAGTCSGSCTDFLTANATNAGMTLTYATNLTTISVGGTAGTPTLTISTITSPLSAGSSQSVTATLLDATGTAVPNTVVTFSVTDSTLATLTPSNGTALTDASGKATVTLNTVNLASGATTLTASSQVGSSAVSASAGFSVGAPSVTLTNFVFGVGAGTLSAFGTTSMSVNVLVGGVLSTTPVTVDFTSSCASTGKASISSSATTVSGVATGSYRDNGCAGTDTVTATVSGSASLQTTLKVSAPAIGSLQFVSASPTTISLKGIGGTETSQVTFKVVDSAGNPLSGQTVSFGLSTSIGGITLTPAGATATSDNNGLVVVTVNAGVVSTPVRVTATSGTLTTQSNQLTITTGIPDQDSFSLSASTHNIEGWTTDGTTSVLTARLADHFNNPVPDGTAVNFTTEGGAIVGSCTTIGGVCTSTFTSQEPRPSNGRVTVLAYAVGEESFTDLNGNGVVDSAAEMVDANGKSTDMPEAFVDYNEDGTRDVYNSTSGTLEPFLDFNSNNAYDAADGKYNGVLCQTGNAICSSTKSIDVRQSQVITLSSGVADIQVFSDPHQYAANELTGATVATSIDLASCNSSSVTGAAADDVTNPIGYFYLRVVDVNGNPMPSGTTITLSTTNGTILSQTNEVMPDSADCNSSLKTTSGTPPPPWFTGCPSSAGLVGLGVYALNMQSDASYNTSTAACTNTLNTGILTITVKSPGGLITTDQISVND